MNLHRGGPRERLITRAQHENNYLHVQDKTIKDLVGGGDCSTVRTGLIFFLCFYEHPEQWDLHSYTCFLFFCQTSGSDADLCLLSSAHQPCCLIIALRGTGLWAGAGSNRSRSVLAGSLLFCLGKSVMFRLHRKPAKGLINKFLFINSFWMSALQH